MMDVISNSRSRVELATLVTLAFACSSAGTAPSPSPSPAPAPATSASARARAFRVTETEAFTRAVAQGTRTRTGVPGPRYWQQWANYHLEANLEPAAKRMTGRGTVTYYNRSPDTLRTVLVHLYDNLFDPDSKSNTAVPWKVEGVTLNRVAAQGQELTPGSGEGPGYEVKGTVMRMRLPQPMMPGDSARFEFGWVIRVPPDGAPRGGQDGEVFVLSYWYPQIAVYDDVSGWQADPYLGNAEFYMGYGNYDVSLSVPAGWLVAATGTLQNADEVLSVQTLERLDSARRAPGPVPVVSDRDRGAGVATTTGAGGKLTWRFTAQGVRDFTWGTSAKYLWDATRAAVGDIDGDGKPDSTSIYAFYRPERRRSQWQQSARYARHAIEFLSHYLWPYPYPHLTTVDGPESCGGMEFPMLTCIGGQWDTLGLYEVTVHEIGHMWFPMQVGSDEKRYAWQDEGFTQFTQSQALANFFKGFDDEARNRNFYLDYALRGDEVELMRHGDRYPNYPSYGVASYYKPATILVALRAVLGDSVFHRAFAEYGRRWAGKHPTPYDFWNTVQDVCGQDLSWFWRTWFFETWRLDQAIDTVTTAPGDSLDVIILNRGRAPMPVHLTVTRGDSIPERLTIPVDVWLTGARRYTLRIPGDPPPTRVEIDPEKAFPDVDRENQVWPRQRTR